MPLRRSLVSLAVAGALMVACSDSSSTTIAPADASTPAPAALASQTLQCTASVTSRTVSCGDAGTGSGTRDIIVGGQNVYVKLTSSNISYNSVAGSAFTFDVTVQNLVPQAMGTTDGTTPDGTGVRVFFQSLPVATSGSGTISITNPTGTNGTFTGSNQTFFTYPAANLGGDGILSQNEVSSTKNWAFNVPNTVTTFAFSVYVSANVAAPGGYVTVASAPAMLASATQVLSATVKSAVGNTISGQTVTFGTSNAAVATVASDGTVTAIGPGNATITATSGARSGAATISVCPNLSVGGVYEYTGTAGASFCLAGSGAGQEYVVIPYNGDNATSLALSVTGSGIVPVVGTPTPSIIPTRSIIGLDLFKPRADYSVEARLREQELALASTLGPAANASRTSKRGPSYVITSGVPTVGSTMPLNVSLNGNLCSAPSGGTSITATVKAVGTHVILMEDNSNPTGGFTNTEYDQLAAAFDTLVYPAVTASFGTPQDIDGNGRVIALYTAAINDLTAANSSSYVGGLFTNRDLYTAGLCAGSNVGEIFYMLAPDPTGVHGNVRLSAFVKSATTGTLGHEFQHLINASIRQGAGRSLESKWLNEGMSHIAEELVYYASATQGPGTNLGNSGITANQAQQDAFFAFGEPNIGRFRQHLLGTEADSPTQDDDDLGTRGSAWAFLRYALDRKGTSPATVLSGLITTTDTGRANVTNRLGTSMDTWLKDWVVSVYADDASLGSASTYLMPTWNFRSIYGGLTYGGQQVFPLVVRDPSNAVAQSMTLAQNAAAYMRMGVNASTFATLSVANSGGGALPPSAAVMVLRRK